MVTTIVRCAFAALALVVTLHPEAGAAAAAQPRPRDEWIALAKGGFAVPAGQTAIDLLIEMNALLASPDPVLRDEVAYSAAERWILRDKVVDPDGVRRLIALWTANLDDGLGTSGDERALKRSFSALCLSVAAARHAATPFLAPAETAQLSNRLLDYFQRERDHRGFDTRLGWIHAVAHTADALKFLARAPDWPAANAGRLLSAVRDSIQRTETVYVWGEAERIGAALHAAVRRPDGDAAVLDAWLGQWVKDHQALWAQGPHIAPVAYARVENAKQVLRALHALLWMELTPSPQAEAARQAVVMALAKMR
jgi:hypothetical protein